MQSHSRTVCFSRVPFISSVHLRVGVDSPPRVPDRLSSASSRAAAWRLVVNLLSRHSFLLLGTSVVRLSPVSEGLELGSILGQTARVSVVGVLVEVVLGVNLDILSFGTRMTKVHAGSVRALLGIPLSETGRIVALAGTVAQPLDILNPIRKVGPLYNIRIHEEEMVPYWKGRPEHGR